MRTTVACFVLATAIATPGIVIAASGSSGQEQAETFGSGSASFHPVGIVGAPIDPRLRQTVKAVTRALARKGVHLEVFPTGAHSADAIESDSHGRCPVAVTFGQRPESNMGSGDPVCTQGEIDSTAGPIVFTPPSLRPTIEQALRRNAR